MSTFVKQSGIDRRPHRLGRDRLARAAREHRLQDVRRHGRRARAGLRPRLPQAPAAGRADHGARPEGSSSGSSKDKTILEPGDSVYLDKDVVHASFNVGDVTARLLVVLAPSRRRRGLRARRRRLRGALVLVALSSDIGEPLRIETPLRIAHRGYRTGAPENSLEAFSAAIAHGADVLEVDVRRRRDGALVAHHDRGDAPDAALLSDVLALAARLARPAQPRSQGRRDRAAARRASCARRG